MEHTSIADEDVLVERYLDHALSPSERAVFEAHMVDCQECQDRLMLAEMFHARIARNGHTQPKPVLEKLPEPVQQIPFRARVVAELSPLEILFILVAAGVLLLAVPTVYFLWQLHRLH